LFLEAGADLAKPQAVDRPEDIARTIAEVPCPFMATLSQAAGRARVDVAEMRQLGVAAVSMPSIALFAAAQAVSTVLEELASGQSLAAVEDRLMPLDTYYNLVGLEDAQAAEERFQAEATRLLQPRAVA
jgi:methylisocitrate lyase